MEVGDQGIDCFETVAGINENSGIVAHGVDNAVFIGGAFQCAAGSSPLGGLFLLPCGKLI